ncbi:MAG: hypothetical protein AB7R67_20135 [Vicinamibacterales bacterium]
MTPEPLVYDVVFDGTPHRLLGRQLCTREEVRRPAPPIRTVPPPVAHRGPAAPCRKRPYHRRQPVTPRGPVEQQLEHRALAVLRGADLTVAALASAMRVPLPVARRAVMRLRADGVVGAVGTVPNPVQGTGRGRRSLVVYGVRA